MFPPDMAGQKKMMETLQVAVDNLHRVDVVMPDIKEMGRRHKDYGVDVSHYALVGWTEIYTTLAGVMTSV